MQGDFLWDDRYFISDNPYMLIKGFLKNFLITPFGGLSGTDENSIRLDRIRQFYRPLTSLSYWIDCKIWGFNPAGFHLTNILIQIVNTVILYFILLSLSLDKVLSFSGSLLFSLFPFHFENVSWISGRTDLLSFLFAACSVFFFIKFLKAKNSVFLAVSSLFYFLSLLSKENTIFLIAVYFLILYWREPKFKNSVILLIPFGLSLAVWAILRNIALSLRIFEYSGRILLDFFAASGFYVIRLLFPFHLSLTIDSFDVFRNIFYQMAGIVTVLLFSVATILLLRKKMKNPILSLVFFSFFVLLLPSLIIIFSASTTSFMAWRFLYAPSAVFVCYLAYILFTKIKYKFVPLVAIALVSLFYAAEIHPKNKAFGKTETDFWLSIKDIDREDMITKFNIAVTCLPKDEKKALDIFNDVLSQKEHHRLKIYETRIYEALAQYYTFKKNFPMAEKYFRKLMESQSYQSQHFHLTYAFFLAFQGKVKEGENIVNRILTMFPQNHLVLLNAAKFYIIIENYEKASELLKIDFSLFPTRETLLLLKKLEEERK